MRFGRSAPSCAPSRECHQRCQSHFSRRHTKPPAAFGGLPNLARNSIGKQDRLSNPLTPQAETIERTLAFVMKEYGFAAFRSFRSSEALPHPGRTGQGGPLWFQNLLGLHGGFRRLTLLSTRL